MPTSERTVAERPFCSSSRPTVALTISAPWRLKFPKVRLAEGVFDLRRGRAQRRPGFGADLRHADDDHSLGRIVVGLHHRVLPAVRVVLVERGTDLLDRHGLIELLDHDGAASELDASRNPLRPNGRDARQNNQPGKREGVPAPPEKVEIGVLEDMHG